MATVTDTTKKKGRKPYKKHPLKEQLDDFIQQLRTAIYWQIKAFKMSELLRSGGEHYLDKKGRKIRQRDASEADHVYPVTFRQLVYDFCQLEKVKITSLTGTEINRLCKLFANYHREHAVLEMVHKNTNKWRFYKNRKNDIPWRDFFSSDELLTDEKQKVEVSKCN